MYLHFFKRGQPSLNWLDPGFAAQRMTHRRHPALHPGAGRPGAAPRRQHVPRIEPRRRRRAGLAPRAPDLDLVHPDAGHGDPQGGGLQLPGAERRPSTGCGRPSRRVPSWATTSRPGPAYLYALATGDAGPLRLMLRLMLEHEVRPGTDGPRPAEPRRADARDDAPAGPGRDGRSSTRAEGPGAAALRADPLGPDRADDRRTGLTTSDLRDEPGGLRDPGQLHRGEPGPHGPVRGLDERRSRRSAGVTWPPPPYNALQPGRSSVWG